jgi:hypothetical protein
MTLPFFSFSPPDLSIDFTPKDEVFEPFYADQHESGSTEPVRAARRNIRASSEASHFNLRRQIPLPICLN